MSGPLEKGVTPPSLGIENRKGAADVGKLVSADCKKVVNEKL